MRAQPWRLKHCRCRCGLATEPTRPALRVRGAHDGAIERRRSVVDLSHSWRLSQGAVASRSSEALLTRLLCSALSLRGQRAECDEWLPWDAATWHAATWHAAAWHATARHASTGLPRHASTGLPWHAASRHAASRHAAAWHAASRHATAWHAAAGHVAAGHGPAGHAHGCRRLGGSSRDGAAR